MTVAIPARSLPEVLEALEAKGLRRGIGPVPGAPVPPALATGRAELDAALRTGGWPRGALAQIGGALGCGTASMALGSLAAAQRAGGLAAWIDLDSCFDPATAARMGVDLDWLLLVRPADAAEAVELSASLIRSRLLDLMVLDLRERGGRRRPLARELERLARLLARGDAVTLLLADVGICEGASVRVALRRLAWLAVGRDLVGQRVEASVIRHRWASAGGRAELDLWFNEGRRIDPLLPALAVPHPPARIEQRPALRVLSA